MAAYEAARTMVNMCRPKKKSLIRKIFDNIGPENADIGLSVLNTIDHTEYRKDLNAGRVVV